MRQPFCYACGNHVILRVSALIAWRVASSYQIGSDIAISVVLDINKRIDFAIFDSSDNAVLVAGSNGADEIIFTHHAL